MPLLNKKDTGLVDLTSSNNNLKEKITNIVENIDNISSEALEKQVIEMLESMMNFFSIYVEEIPNFSSLSLEQQKIIIKKFKDVSVNLKKRKIKSVNQIAQAAVFAVLNSLSNNVEDLKELTVEEILRKKHKKDFRKFLKNAAEYEAIQATQSKKTESQDNFISQAVKFGVKEALKNLNINISFQEMNIESVKILQEAHTNYKKSKKQDLTLSL